MSKEATFTLTGTYDDGLVIPVEVNIKYPEGHAADATQILLDAFAQEEEIYQQLFLAFVKAGDSELIKLAVEAGMDLSEYE